MLDKSINFPYHFPYLEVDQKGESFYLTKMPVSILKKLVNFHFRIAENDSFTNADQYIAKLEKLGIETDAVENGLQRRTDLKRINDISSFVNESEGIVFPTPLVLSLNVFEKNNEKKEDYYIFYDNEIYFSENVEFTIIDGQHRLAGLVAAFSKDKVNNDIEMPITLLLDANISIASKMFIDINGNQRKVNKSVIYDLFENTDPKEVELISRFASAVRVLNSKKSSPLYKRIKMLGTGDGTISQAFMIDYLMNSYKPYPNFGSQEIYSNTFVYFNLISRIYEKEWNSINEKGKLDSLLVKTNGMGALLLLLSNLIDEFGLPMDNQKTYLEYFESRKEFNWNDDAFSGTGKKVQKQIMENLKDFSKNNSNY